jgi:hypothetical protein
MQRGSFAQKAAEIKIAGLRSPFISSGSHRNFHFLGVATVNDRRGEPLTAAHQLVVSQPNFCSCLEFHVNFAWREFIFGPW